MKIEIDYEGKDLPQLQSIVASAYEEVESFFVKKPEILKITIHKNRKSLEEKLGRKTFEWEIATASFSGDINILHPDSFAKESTHAKDEFLPILKHEITHIFLDLLSGGNKIPKWLDEGFSSYVAGLKISEDSIFIEDNFCKKLGTPRGWDEQANYSAYTLAQLFVGFLIKKYSVEKIIELLSMLEKNYYYDHFNSKFKMIFGENLEDIEKDFVKAIN
jgi:hypothetical protein